MNFLALQINRKTGWSLFCMALGLPLLAQVDSTILHASTAAELKLGIKNSTQHTDTLLDNLHNYYETGVLGNIGLPSYSLLAGSATAHDGFFKWMELNNQRDLYTSSRPVYFHPQGKIHTRVFGAMGQKLEQVFKLLHAQQIKRTNISLAFNRYSCFGFYSKQRSLTDNLLLSSHATTRNGRLGYNFYLLYNKLKYELNGGIDTSRVNFADNILVEKKLFPVLLSTAKQNIRTTEINLESFWRLNRDSAHTGNYLAYEVNYQSNYWLYTDNAVDSSRYANTFIYYTETGGSRDSVSFKRLSNSLLYKIVSERWLLYGGYKHEFAHYYQTYTDTLTSNHVALAGFRLSPKNQLLALQGQYVLSGFNANNYLFDVSYRARIKSFHAQVNLAASQQMIPYMTRHFFGAHFIWSDTFADLLTQSAKLEFGSAKYKFVTGAYVQSQQNLVYFDTLALPRQHNEAVMLSRLYLQKDLKLGPVHFNNTLHYQITDNTEIIRLPAYYTSHQLYYEGKLFRKALWLQAGVQARYVAAFRANAYMPATNQFFLQNEREYGNYVWVDVFVNAQIDRFRFFLLGSHLNQGLSGANYMLAPNYPMPDRSLKAGLCWMFFD